MPIPRALALVLLLCVPSLAQEAPEHPRELRIVAEIDGVDELHVSATRARVTHKAFSMPKRVAINHHSWSPEEHSNLEVGADDPFLAADIDLAGAELRVERGRGQVLFRHDGGGLIISFDDSQGAGSDEYIVVVRFADEICAAREFVGATLERGPFPKKLLIEARVDGVDELHLSSRRADWLHLAWSWPEEVQVGGLAWEPEIGPLHPTLGPGFFSPHIDLSRVRLTIEEARGSVSLEVLGDRLCVRFDDGEEIGAGSYRVHLMFPKAPRSPETLIPGGRAHRVEVSHGDPADVVGARLRVLVLSPKEKTFVPWPGQRGMDSKGRCVLALASGRYRFEVLNRPSANRLVALRTPEVRVSRGKTILLPAAAPSVAEWKTGEERIEWLELAVHSMVSGQEVQWNRESGQEPLELVVSPAETFSMRAFGANEEGYRAWWTKQSFGEHGEIDSQRQPWVRCRFDGVGEAELPANCEVTLHAPSSRLPMTVASGTRLLTNRRFVGISYSYDIHEGARAIFHQRQVLLPKLGRRESFQLGGELQPRGSAWVMLNENLGSPTTRQLWWELNLVDPSGWVLDTGRSSIDWKAKATLVGGAAIPAFPLEPQGLAVLGDPAETVELVADYSWHGDQHVELRPARPATLENESYRSVVPGHLEGRARAYLDKARRIYSALELAIGRPGPHDRPIELKWWLNGGAIGAWGSITMPLQGMTEDFDWFSLPWSLGHESLHAFGYHHSPELDRLDAAAIAEFERLRWLAERNPSFVPPEW